MLHLIAHSLQSSAVRVPVLVLLAFSAAACSDISRSTTPDELPERAAAVSRQPLNPIRTFDDVLLDLAEKIPGFGGLSYDDVGNIRVVLTDLSKAQLARLVVAEFMSSRPHAATAAIGEPVPPIQFVQGQFDWTQLKTWKDSLRSLVFQDPGVVFLDADEFRNQLTIGLATAADEERVRALIGPLGLAKNAVAFEIRGRTELRATLRNSYSPRIGGLGISIGRLVSSGQLQDCTHGPRITLNTIGDYALLTNSHCTETLFAMTSTRISQGGQWVGTEVSDLELIQNDRYADCPVGRWCRYSDAAAIDYDSGITSQYGIAFTGLPSCSGMSCGGKLTIEGTVAVTTTDFPVMNMQLNKTGQRTGWTRGAVTGTCVDTNWDSVYYPPAGGTITPLMLCQIHTQIWSEYGDSGSPVYQRYTYTSGTPGYARMHGMMWGGPANNFNVTYVSPVDGIGELGSILYH